MPRQQQPNRRVFLLLILACLAVVVPPFAASASDTNELRATADGWVNSARPRKNAQGLETRLKTYGAVWEAYVQFDLTAWRGRSFDSLQLRLDSVTGDGTTLAVRTD